MKKNKNKLKADESKKGQMALEGREEGKLLSAHQSLRAQVPQPKMDPYQTVYPRTEQQSHNNCLELP